MRNGVIVVGLLVGSFSLHARADQMTFIRGVVVDRDSVPRERIRIAIYAVPTDETRPSLCGGTERVRLFDEQCEAAKAEVKRLLDAGELAAKPLLSVDADDQGRFEFKAPAVKFDLVATDDSHGIGVLLNVAPGDEPLRVKLSHGVARGTVRTGDNVPMPDAKVALVLARPRLVWLAETSPAGKFVAGPVPDEGELIVWTKVDGYRAALDRGEPTEERSLTLRPPAPLVRVHGVASWQGQPQPGVEVFLGDRMKVTTGPDGAFEAALPIDEEVTFTATKGDLYGSVVTPSYIQVPKLRADIVLGLTRTLRVRVVDAKSGKPVASELLVSPEIHTLVSFETMTTVINDETFVVPGKIEPKVERVSASEFIVRHLPRETYRLEAVGENDAYREEIVEPADNSTERTIRLKEGQKVSGVVVSKKGTPIAGATVSLFQPGAIRDQRETVTDEQGRFRFQNCSGDDAFVNVSAEGHASAFQRLGVLPIRKARVVLPPAQKAVVQVVSKAGTPVEGATVTCMSESSESTAKTDAKGTATCSIADVDAEYMIKVEADGFVPSTGESFIAEKRRVHREKVVLRLRRPIRGVVVDERGAPRPGVELTLVGDERFPSNLFHAVTDMLGAFEFSEIGEGNYELEVALGGPKLANVRGGETNARAVWPRAAVVRGIVREENAPISELKVNGEAVVLRNGAFAVEMPAGEKRELTLTGEFTPKTISVKTEPGSTVELGVINVLPPSRLLGKVLGVSAPGLIWFEGYDQASKQKQPAVYLANGEFSASGIAPGRYRATVETDRGEVTRDFEIRDAQETKLEIELPSGATALSCGASVEACVEFAMNKMFQGALGLPQ